MVYTVCVRVHCAYPVVVEQLYGPEDIKLAGHEKLDGQLPGQRRHSMLAGPLVDLFQELFGSLGGGGNTRTNEAKRM